MKLDISGPAHSVGSTYHWSGNSQVGEGHMTMTAVEPGARAEIKLDFLKPFPTTHLTEFTVAPGAEGQTLTWTMRGHHSFLGKAMSLVMDMDKMVGKDFENGLSAIKAKAEKEASAAAQPTAEAPAVSPEAP